MRKIFARVLQGIRLRALLNQAKKCGGKILTNGTVIFDQNVVFQGRGQLLLHNNVRFGYRLGGSPTLPILLQPRECNSIIEIGEGTILVNGTELLAREKIQVGKNCRIGARCLILDSDFHGIRTTERNKVGITKPVIIGNDVLIGIGVIILKGIVIGDDAIIGAGSVVTKNVPAGGIAVGNPVRIIGSVYEG